MSLAAVIEAKRVEAELSISALARACEVSTNWMSTLEREGKIPSDELLDRMTSVFEDDKMELHIAAALERGSVTVPVSAKNAKLLVPVLLELRELAPKMTSGTIKAFAEAISG